MIDQNLRVALRGVATAGKSTLAAQLIGNDWAIGIDADNRLGDQAYLAPNIIRVINSDLTALGKEVERLKNPPKPKKGEEEIIRRPYKWMLIDSYTHIVAPIIAGSMYDNRTGKSANQSSGSMDKATSMRVVQGYGLGIPNFIAIWHLELSTFYNGKDKVEKYRSTVPDTEWERLKHDCHLLLEVKKDAAGKRSVVVEWCRFDDGGVIPVKGEALIDTQGRWVGFRERLQWLLHKSRFGYTLEYMAYVYGLTPAALKQKLNGYQQPAVNDKKGWGDVMNQIKEATKATEVKA